MHTCGMGSHVLCYAAFCLLHKLNLLPRPAVAVVAACATLSNHMWLHIRVSHRTCTAAHDPWHACMQVVEGLNDTPANLLSAIERNEAEVSPSTLYAVACVQEGVPFINGSPQNTFVPGLIDMAVEAKVLIAGDDFKSGQTKMKSVLVDFLVGAGLKPTSIVSYNHLGNNDGMNLSAPQVSWGAEEGLETLGHAVWSIGMLLRTYAPCDGTGCAVL